MSMIIDNKFEIGDVVYLKTDTEQKPRIVYCIKVFKGEYLYDLTSGTQTSSHYDFEISTEVNVLITTTN